MRSDRFFAAFYAGVLLSVCVSLLALAGCAVDPCNPGWGIHACDGTADDSGSSSDENQGGGDATVIQLPFAAGTSWRCTQGTNGSYSHTYDSTQYGVDYDTPNDSDVEIYSPVSGVAYVHEESATSNFGYAVNVDLGNGTYVVLGHNSQIFVTDGQEVAAGTLLAYDGCTGACSGDHSHVGLMEGDASEMAQDGTSVDDSFYTRDTNVDGSVLGAVDAEDFVCGTSDGHVYESALPVPQWHPDGTLVKVPSDPSVYLVEDGKARHVSDEATFWSYGLDFDDVALISDEELACLGTGDEISSSGSVAAGYGEDGNAWLVVSDTDGSSWKQRLPNGDEQDVLSSWGLSGDLGMDETISQSELDRYATRSGTAPFRDGAIVKEESASDVYVVSDGIALPVKDWDAYLLMGYANRAILTVSDGEVSSVMGNDGVGSCSAGVWCLDAEAVTTCGGGLDLGSGAEAGGEEIDTGGSTETDPVDDTGSNETDSSDSDTGTGDSSSEPPAEEDTAADTSTSSGSEVDTSDTAAYVYLDDPFVCFSTTGFRTPYDNADAYAVGYGGTLDWTLQASLLASPDDVATGYVCLDTSSWVYDDYELTLVSSIQSDGSAATSYLDVGDWWDNYDFCTDGSDASAGDYCVSQGGWDYLVGFTKTTSGLFPNGDGA